MPRDRSLLKSLVLIGVLSFGVAACGDDIREQSLCDVYADYLDDLAAVQDLDPNDTSAGEAADVAEDYLESVRHLQEAADSRYTDQLNTLEAAAADVLRTLESVDEDEDYATWAPLVEDSYELAADAAVTVADLFEVQCPNSGDVG